MVGCNSHYGHGLRVSPGSTVHIPVREGELWLKKTRRKALFASLEKIKEELMLLGLISLLLGQWASVISQICVDSSLFSTKFFICSEEDYGMADALSITKIFSLNETDIPPKGISNPSSHQCGEGREPFVSYQGLEQLHRFLFVLGMTHVLYSCIAVGLAMSKVRFCIRRFTAGENGKTKQAYCLVGIYKVIATSTAYVAWCVSFLFLSGLCFVAKKNKVMRRQSTFILHRASHPWSRSRVLIWMLCFLRQFRSSIQKSDYFALRLGFITVGSLFLHLAPNHQLPLSYNFHNYIVRSMEDEFYGMVGISWPLWGYALLCIFINIHGLNIYFWLSFIPAIVSVPSSCYPCTGIKIDLLLVHNSDAFVTHLSKLVMLVGTKLQHVVSVLALEIVEPRGPSTGTQVKPRDDLFWFGKPDILLRLIQFISFQNAFEMATFIWSVVRGDPLGIQAAIMFHEEPCNDHYSVNLWMGSRCKKALIAESVRESLHSWCKRVKEKSRRDALHSVTTRSTCSLGSTIDEGDEVITVASGTLSPCSSNGSLNRLDENMVSTDHLDNATDETFHQLQHEVSFRMSEYSANPISNGPSQPMMTVAEDNVVERDGEKVETLMDLFRKT
ncbi:hypothetical protein RJ640_002379 [Escallonia rubra]|uniref:MLO-like protein n=1 Tax=Escallonia rubra TaxID=112253 RepID=A0AA88QL49_9ASTE|nr:hypothetical protein RJ640_002379 [Escallonia rubra]